MDKLTSELKCMVVFNREHNDHYTANQIESAIDRMTSLESELKCRAWINVEKSGLPDKDGHYLILANDIVNQWQEVRWLKTHHRKRFIDDDGHSDYPPIVTHWMKLPEAPQ